MHARCTGAGGLPLRLLDNFSLSGGKRGSQLMGLEALHARGGTSLTLRGALLPAAGRSAKRDGDNCSSDQAWSLIDNADAHQAAMGAC